LAEDFIQKEVACVFIDEINDHDDNQHLIMSTERSLNEAFDQALKLEAVKAAAVSSLRLWEVRAVASMRTFSPTTEYCGTESPACWRHRSPQKRLVAELW
jgi:hypothetical protein